MLKRLIILFVFLFASAGILFAQEKGEKRATAKCLYCKKEIDKSDIVIVSQELFGIEKPIREMRICAECNKLPKCYVCHAPTENKLDDDLYLCKGCGFERPWCPNNSEAKEMTEEVRQTLASVFKMNIKQKITVDLDSEENIKKTHPFVFAYNAGGRIVYTKDGPENPKIRFYSIAAYELAHSWYNENGPFKADINDVYDDGNKRHSFNKNSEGFAEFIAWCYLKHIKDSIPKDDISFLEYFLDAEIDMLEKKGTDIANNTPLAHVDKIYGDGFRKIRKLMGDARTAPEWKKILQKELKSETGKEIPEKIQNGTCAYCSKPAEVKSSGGDLLCRDCAKTSVKDKAEAERILKDVRRVLSAKFKMSSRHVLTYEICTRKELNIGVDGNPAESGSFVPDVIRNKRQYTIRILSGLPREVFRSVGAHELAHDWMDETLPHLMNNTEVREGFAEYVAWSFSKEEGSQRMVETIETRTDHVYGDGFRKMKKLLSHTKTATEWKTILLREYPSNQTKNSGRKNNQRNDK